MDRSPETDTKTDRVYPARVLVGLCAVSAVLVILAFPDPGQDWTVWFALVPWLWVLSRTRLRRALWLSWVAGMIFITWRVSWLRFVTVAGWLLLAGYLSCYLMVWGGLVRWLCFSRRRPLLLVGPCAWVGLEYLRATLLTGFPWLLLGHTQYSRIHLIQMADIFGVYGISFLVVLVNCVIFEICSRLETAGRRTGALLTPAIPAVACIVCALLYGTMRVREANLRPGPRVGVVQANIPQSLKMDTGFGAMKDCLDKHLQLSDQLVGENLDMLIWPESMIPGILNLPPNYRRPIDVLSAGAVSRLAAMHKCHLLIGGVALELRRTLAGVKQFPRNSAYLFSRDAELLQRYDKVHLVPFGEYIPLRRYFPFLARIVPYEVAFEPGRELSIFEVNGFRFATPVCYEDTVPDLMRGFRRKGADFFVNVTNDGWFRESAELPMHLAISVFRCVETRAGLVRAANTGISALIDPLGRVTKAIRVDGRRRAVAGTLVGRLHVDDRETWYCRFGEWFVWCCMAVVGVAVLPAVTWRKPKSG